ncbi:MAG: hypothetical protein FJZ15_05745 [Candidatus Omnitrophica bacterium]|nr:hypothetical protein [Candidatus Omnitrophota bacterium]
MSARISIEIGKLYLKIVTANSQGIQTKFSDCIIEPAPGFTDEQISQKIALIFSQEKIKTKSVTVCLSRDCVTIKNLHLPSKNQQEINQMLDLHIARVVPYKKDEIVYAYQSLGSDEMGYSRMILAIAHKDVIKRQERILEKAGLYIEKILLSSYGIWQWVARNNGPEIKGDDLYFILDFDSTFTDFVIFSQKNLYLTRGIAVGSKAIEDSKEAGLTKLLGEIKQSLIIFYKEEINKKITRAFCCGANMPAPYLAIIEKELGVTVKQLPRVFPDDVLKTKGRIVPYDTSITGISELTLQDNKQVISFVLPEMQIRKSVRERARDLIILGSLAAYILFVGFAIFLSRIYSQYSYLNKLNQRFASIGEETEDLINKSRKNEFIKGYLNQRKIPYIVMYKLQGLITPEVAISSIVIGEDNSVTLRGQAVQLSDVTKFVASIEKNKFFQDVQRKYMRTKKYKEKEVSDFEITFNLAI